MISKTAKEINPYLTPGYHSDKPLMRKYYDAFGDKLLTGDYQGKWIDEKAEREHVNELRKYYDTMRGSENKLLRIPKWDVKAIENGEDPKKLMRTNALREGATISVALPALLGMSALPSIGYMAAVDLSQGDNPIPTLKAFAKRGIPLAVLSGLGLGAVAAGSSMWKHSRHPYTGTSMPVAKRRFKMTDEQLLDLLRGDVIREKTEKKVEDFIATH